MTVLLFIFLILFYEHSFAQKEFSVFLYDSLKVYSKEEIQKLLPIERELIKSEILAKYGYVFDDTLLQRYFRKQMWYKGKSTEFPQLNQIDSINYFNFDEHTKFSQRTVRENVKRFKPIFSDFVKEYYSYCFENSSYRTIAKRKFKLRNFNYCYRQVFYVPRLELPISPLDFERFLSEDDFNVHDYAIFKVANDVRGIIFRGYFTRDGKLLQMDEVGVDPGINLGKVVTENYVDSEGRIFLHYNKMCNDSDVKEIARILDYDENQPKVKREILILEDEVNLYFQITTSEYFIEAGMRKKK